MPHELKANEQENEKLDKGKQGMDPSSQTEESNTIPTPTITITSASAIKELSEKHIPVYVYVLTEFCHPEAHAETWNATHGVFTTLELAKTAARDRAADVNRLLMKDHGESVEYKESTSYLEGFSDRVDCSFVIDFEDNWLGNVFKVEKVELMSTAADVRTFKRPLYLDDYDDEDDE